MPEDDPAYRLAAAGRFLAPDDVTAIERLVRELRAECGRPVRVLDLGAGSGTTALAVLCADAEAEVTVVDESRDALQRAERNFRPYFPGACWQGVLGAAAEVAEQAAGEPVDLLLYDASHERDDILRDVRAWVPHLRPGARVWVHDYAPAPWGGDAYPGVAEACAELVAAGDLVELGAVGMGWIGRRP